MRAQLYLESEMDEPQSFDHSQGRVMAYARTCPGKQEPNDDSAAVICTQDDGLVLAVADGVGGSPLGHKASGIAMQCLSESLQSAATFNGDLRPLILDGIERANAEILDLAIGAATTLSVIEVKNRVARGYQVGDSMAVIVGQRGLVKWKSTSHSPIGYAIESGLMGEDEAMYHDERHFVSNLVGSKSMHIEIGPAIKLAALDTIILASDGLFDNLTLDEICSLSRVGPPARRMRSLIDQATAQMQTDLGKPDDLSIVLLAP
ncbi:MAG: protein phosphatase 2C domain-containing protein [Planctomycetales bacterium]|nr:protein phosphatase 2C domain-containing protein [Planctomycetales bacterium]